MLGGKDNLAVDREAVDRIAEHIPAAIPLARANRAFLQRSVRHLAAAGVRQFLDLGSGLPTGGNVHEVVREVSPDAKVVYVDHDPVVATHARALLEEEGKVVFVQADLLRPAELLAMPEVTGFLDLNQPVAVLLVSILHFVQDADDPASMVKVLRDAVAPGSYLVLTHAVEGLGQERDEENVRDVYRGSSTGGAQGRELAEIRAFFGDFELIEPGLVHVCEWRPDHPDLIGEEGLPGYLMAGVARKG
ncbi:S-adenosyl methyltransferase [Nonomuraea jiangxiensis]|uniref:S-adenosyl methyltransferase n=2 Tax=Nonomuraea jiangxiensis TaxID=633440 RepID=A0A1G8T4B3_9ACTN|nr:S-adenosyl methyltransferase [Nonomuraea jiangxiensis]